MLRWFCFPGLITSRFNSPGGMFLVLADGDGDEWGVTITPLPLFLLLNPLLCGVGSEGEVVGEGEDLGRLEEEEEEEEVVGEDEDFDCLEGEEEDEEEIVNEGGDLGRLKLEEEEEEDVVGEDGDFGLLKLEEEEVVAGEDGDFSCLKDEGIPNVRKFFTLWNVSPSLGIGVASIMVICEVGEEKLPMLSPSSFPHCDLFLFRGLFSICSRLGFFADGLWD